jgi:hypothetical protein
MCGMLVTWIGMVRVVVVRMVLLYEEGAVLCPRVETMSVVGESVRDIPHRVGSFSVYHGDTSGVEGVVR